MPTYTMILRLWLPSPFQIRIVNPKSCASFKRKEISDQGLSTRKCSLGPFIRSSPQKQDHIEQQLRHWDMLLPMYGDKCHARVCPGGLKLKQEKRVSFLLSEPEEERTHTRSEQV
uniref:Orf114b n=1 Tax=Batis maritima TaxID=4436 RepID=A0A068BFC3_BATMA|nr:orf114b [Batis maritima]AIC83399.1 orf114b [Batis maritima]